MPRYVYACSKCDGEFQTRHGMSETLEICELCEEKGSLRRIPQLTSISKPQSESAKRVKEAIKENKDIFKEMHKEASNQHVD